MPERKVVIELRSVQTTLNGAMNQILLATGDIGGSDRDEDKDHALLLKSALALVQISADVGKVVCNTRRTSDSKA